MLRLRCCQPIDRLDWRNRRRLQELRRTERGYIILKDIGRSAGFGIPMIAFCVQVLERDFGNYGALISFKGEKEGKSREFCMGCPIFDFASAI